MSNSITLYKMCMKFKLTVGFKSINDIARICRVPEPIAKDAITVSITQTVPFIPTDDIIAQYEHTIKKHYDVDSLSIKSCKFDGYEYLTPITMDKTDISNTKGV